MTAECQKALEMAQRHFQKSVEELHSQWRSFHHEVKGIPPETKCGLDRAFAKARAIIEKNTPEKLEASIKEEEEDE